MRHTQDVCRGSSAWQVCRQRTRSLLPSTCLHGARGSQAPAALTTWRQPWPSQGQPQLGTSCTTFLPPRSGTALPQPQLSESPCLLCEGASGAVLQPMPALPSLAPVVS